MKRRDGDEDESGIRHPRETANLIGHAEAERAMLDAYRGGRMPHAWLIGGPVGIGKATLAYRAARFVLAHRDPRAATVQSATSMEVAPDHPTFRHMAAEAHPDLFVLQRTLNDRGTLRSVITVDDVRRASNVFALTPGEGGWRVCIVDAADELQYPQAANALLKILEEPPARSLFFLVSHTPGRLLPTIRSRCRLLRLHALTEGEVTSIVTDVAPDGTDADTIARAAAMANGSVGRALALTDKDGLALRTRVAELLASLPNVDGAALHRLGEQIAGSDPAPLAAFTETVRDWLSAQVAAPGADPHRLARVAEVWDKVVSAARDVEIYNLERKPLVFSVFGWLSATAR